MVEQLTRLKQENKEGNIQIYDLIYLVNKLQKKINSNINEQKGKFQLHYLEALQHFLNNRPSKVRRKKNRLYLNNICNF